jgi:hypothetical protein
MPPDQEPRGNSLNPFSTIGSQTILPIGDVAELPGNRPVVVHIPKAWASEWSLRINWLTRNFGKGGIEEPINPPAPFEIKDPLDPLRTYRASIGGMDGTTSNHFVADRHVTLRQARLIAALLTFRSDFAPEFELPRLSLRGVARRMQTGGGSKDMTGGRRIRELCADLELLETLWIRTERPWAKVHVEADKLIRFKKNERYVKDLPQVRENLEAEWITEFSMHPEFIRVVDDEGRAIRLDVLNSFQSEMLQLWYLVIPALASHPNVNEKTPWQRGLRYLFHQAGVCYKSWGSKEFRLERGGKLAIEQMDGAETMNGRVRLRLKENSDGDDWMLQAWIERPLQRGLNYKPEGMLFSYWLASGKSKEEFEERLKRGLGPLGQNEIEVLEACRYAHNRPGNHAFLRQSKALLGEARFNMAIHEAKVSIAEYGMAGAPCEPGRIVGTSIKDAYQKMLAKPAGR